MPLKIMSLTDAAAERVREIMEDSETPVTGDKAAARVPMKVTLRPAP